VVARLLVAFSLSEGCRWPLTCIRRSRPWP
jgi:hypothetical protein